MALSLTSSSMTTGTLLSLSNSASGNDAGTVLSVSNSEANAASYGIKVTSATTGSGYGIYSAMTATGNSGYAGYFANTSTTNTGYALYATNTGAGYALAATGTSYFNGNVGIGTTSPAGQLEVESSQTYAVYAATASTTTGAAVFGAITGTGNTGYAGYFANTSTGVLNYGLYASTSSASGYAGYFNGAVNITGNLTGTNAALNGTTTVTNLVVTGTCIGCETGDDSLSSLTAATGTNTIDSGANAQVWEWSTLSTGTAMALTTSSMTSGTLLSLQNTAAASTATGDVLSVTNASTGAGYGISSAITGHGNTGYAGYFANTDTGSDVNYTLYALNDSTSGYAIYCNATNGSGCGGNEAWHNSSDARLKDRIETLPDARGLDAVTKLRPVTYHWRDPRLDQHQMVGFIAQEVEPLYPEAVGTGPDGMKNLAYSDLVVPLVKAVQQQQVEIEQIKADGAMLRRELAGKTLGREQEAASASGNDILLLLTGGVGVIIFVGMGATSVLFVRVRREMDELRKVMGKKRR
jgi:hypothetical protein